MLWSEIGKWKENHKSLSKKFRPNKKNWQNFDQNSYWLIYGSEYPLTITDVESFGK